MEERIKTSMVSAMSHTVICCQLHVLCEELPVFDVLCKRMLSFMHACINSECGIVRPRARYAVSYGRMLPPFGRNALFFFLRCNMDIGSRPSDHYFRSVCLSVCLCRVFLSRL